MSAALSGSWNNRPAIRFIWEVLCLAVPIWCLFSFVAGIAIIPEVRWPAAGLFGIAGTLLSPPIAAVTRAASRRGWSRILLGGIFAAIVICAGVIWFALGKALLSLTNDAVPIASQSRFVLMFLAGTILTFLYPLKLRVTQSQQRHLATAWRNRPKVGLAHGRVNLWTIDEDLEQLERALTREQDAELVRTLRGFYRLQMDPRSRRPLILSEAVDLVMQALASNAATASVRVEGLPKDGVLVPSLLYEAMRFLTEYGRKYRHDVRLTLKEGDEGSRQLLISSNVPFGDLWFQLPVDSAAAHAKKNFVESLNDRSIRETSRFEVVRSRSGNLDFLIDLDQESLPKADWRKVEAYLGPNVELISDCPAANGANHVYGSTEYIHKVELGAKSQAKLVSIDDELLTLQALSGVKGVPEVISFQDRQTFKVLTTRRVQGIPLDQYLGNGPERSCWFRCISELSSIIDAIHKRGIVHRDLLARNILVGDDGRITLLDFDQAVGGSARDTGVDLVGVDTGSVMGNASMKTLITQLNLQKEYEDTVRTLELAWNGAAKSNASSPGKNIAYYNYLFGYTRLPGERPWNDRWLLLGDFVRSLNKGARVMELGCNLGLLSTHAALWGAETVIAVDLHESILQAARLMTKAAGVRVEFVEGDLEEKDFVHSRLISAQPDVLFALSVAHWLENKNPLADLFSSVATLFFEGHEAGSTESAWLKSLGFKRIELIGYTERLRPLLVAFR